ncbi:MAG: Rieske (2Fe-2S) protein [Bacteroidia bacterium]
MQKRREFIKQSCTLCLGVLGVGVLSTQLTSCSPLPIFKTVSTEKIIDVPLSSFNQEVNIVIVRDANLQFDIALIKKTETDYDALELKCTHQANSLTATKTGFMCAAHGSTFDLDGKVTKEPALLPLKKYKTQLTGTSILIYLT